MAFPVVATSATSSTNTSTTLSVTMPSGITTGDLLIMIVGCRAASVNTVTGWTSFADGTGSATDQRAFWREADETEGASVSVGFSVAASASAACFRITGAEDPDTTAPEGASNAVDSDQTTANLPALTPTGGAKDYLWIASTFTRTDFTISAYPASYTDNQTTVQGPTTTPNRSGYATRNLNASTDTGGSFTFSGAGDYTTLRIAVHPTGGASQSIVPIILNLTDPQSGGTI